MSYTITKSDATLLTSIPDGGIDQNTSLTLIGKNSSGYGLLFNENLVYLLENFANSNSPRKPLTGQLWYDTNQGRLKVFDAAQQAWKVSGGTIVSPSSPVLTAGDIWIDSLNEQLKFSDGLNTLLAGPIYTASQGLSGFQVQDVIDTNNLSHTVLSLYLGGVLLGVYNRDTAFVVGASSNNLYGVATVGQGFTAAGISGFLFDQLVSRSKSLVANDGSLKTAGDFVTTTGNSIMTGALTIANTAPLKLGTSGSIEFDVTPTDGLVIKSLVPNQNFLLQLKDGNNSTNDAIHATANSHFVGIYNSNPQATLHIGTNGGAVGSVIIEGNLTVKGSTTSTSTLNVSLADYTVTLANTASPSDATANGAGLIVAGSTNKTWLYSSATTAFNSSENINLATGKTYKINGATVISATELGSGITRATGLQTIGSLLSLQAAYLNIQNNTISYVNSGQTTGNIRLSPLNGSVDVTTNKIINLATPIIGTDAANKNYVDSTVKTATVSVGLPTTGLSNSTIASTFLSKIFLNTDHNEGCLCNVITITSDVTNGTIKQFKLTSGTWVYQTNL